MLACPSQNSVVIRFTFSHTTVTVLSDGITSGRNDKLCGQIGVMHMAATLGVMIGPPAATLYAVLPLGVAMMTPSP